MTKKKTSKKKVPKSKVFLEPAAVNIIREALDNNIFFDPNTGQIEIHGTTYQLRHLRSRTKLRFNNKGELEE